MSIEQIEDISRVHIRAGSSRETEGYYFSENSYKYILSDIKPEYFDLVKKY